MNTTSLPNSCHDELPQAVIKSLPGDFRVDEELGFDPECDGEHLWVHFQKTGLNTRDVIELLARELSVAARDIGYSGLKDRHAVTTQWVSIPLSKVANRSNAQTDVMALLSREDALDCLRVCTGQKKLKPGTHQSNRFTIVLRDLSVHPGTLDSRLEQIAACGFPNYFGVQRFGRDGSNVARAASMFRGRSKVSRFKRGIYLSAARAWLFNLVLACRVEDESWNKIVDGELCILNGSNSIFSSADSDDSLQQRCDELDIHPSGPMHGRGKPLSFGKVAAIESTILAAHPELAEGLESAGLHAERRALRAIANNLQWQQTDNSTLELTFTLRRGVYATALLAEIAQVSESLGGYRMHE